MGSGRLDEAGIDDGITAAGMGNDDAGEARECSRLEFVAVVDVVDDGAPGGHGLEG